jgi:SAM-dependent methyltransferase
MPLADRIAETRASLAKRGLLPTIALVFRGLYRLARPRKPTTHPFDLQHGVDTSGLTWAPNLRSGHPNDAHITAYWGTAPSVFNALLTHWQALLTAHAPQDYTFIDIGCGKGRVVMLASNTPFRQVIGVELVPELATIAQTNLATWQLSPHTCNQLTILHADALEFPFPEGPTLVYLYNPFSPALLKLLLDRLEPLSQTRPIDLAFVYRFPPELFNRPSLRLLWEGDLPFSKEDASADVFYGEIDHCSLYRMSPPS